MIIKDLHIIFFLFCLLFQKATAQGNDQCGAPYAGTGSMRIVSGKSFGCVPLTISVENGDSSYAQDAKYIYEYLGGTPQNAKPEKTHTYTKAGVYKLMQISYLSESGEELHSCLVVAVRDTIQPPFEIKTCSNRSITLTILPAKGSDGQAMNYDKYLIDWGDSSALAEIFSINGSLSKTYANNSSRKISVKGWYQYGECGGTSTKNVLIPNEPPKPIIQRVTSLDEATTELQILNPSGVEYSIYKNENNQGFQATTQRIKNSGTINISANANLNNCFELISNDACAANIQSEIACNIRLDVQPEIPDNLLVWQTQKAKDITIFKNEKILTNYNSLIINQLKDTNIVCKDEYCYQVVAKNSNYDAYSLKGCVKNNLISCQNSNFPIFIPTAFTPNGDGQNDAFEIKGEAKYFVRLQIFNRWGEIIFSADDIKSKWEATNMPAGAYLFRLDAKDKTGNLTVQSGMITLIR